MFERGQGYHPERRSQRETLADNIISTYGALLIEDLQSSTLFQDEILGEALRVVSIEAQEVKYTSREVLLFTAVVTCLDADGQPTTRTLMVKRTSYAYSRDAQTRNVKHLAEYAPFLQEKSANQHILSTYAIVTDPQAELTIEVMPVCEAADLNQTLAAGGLTNWMEVKQAIESMLVAFGIFHTNGVVQGDFKLGNMLKYQGQWAVSDSLHTMFEYRDEYQDEDQHLQEDARVASISRSMFFADPRYGDPGDTESIKDFGYDHYAVCVAIYQLFNNQCLPYEPPNNRFGSYSPRVLILREDRYYPTLGRIQYLSIPDEPGFEAQLVLMRDFLSRLDNILQANLARYSPDQEFFGNDQGLVPRLRTTLRSLFKASERSGLDFDLLLKLTQLDPKKRTPEAVATLWRDHQQQRTAVAAPEIEESQRVLAPPVSEGSPGPDKPPADDQGKKKLVTRILNMLKPVKPDWYAQDDIVAEAPAAETQQLSLPQLIRRWLNSK